MREKLPVGPKKIPDEVVLPENIPVRVTELELKEQLGHMTTQLLYATKVEAHLREVIKNLRKEYGS